MRHFPRLITLATVAGVAAVTLPAASFAATPPKQVGTTINLAGKGSIGALKIGISPATTKKLLGKPDHSDSQGYSGKASDLSMSYKRYGLNVHFFRGTQGGKVSLSGITITSSQYRTSKGVGVGSTTAQLLGAYGRKITCFHGVAAAGGPFCNYTSGYASTPFFTRGTRITSIMLA